MIIPMLMTVTVMKIIRMIAVVMMVVLFIMSLIMAINDNDHDGEHGVDGASVIILMVTTFNYLLYYCVSSKAFYKLGR